MREVSADDVTRVVAALCEEVNVFADAGILRAMEAAREQERGLARDVLDMLVENAAVAKRTRLPICQDTGLAVVFVTIGQEVYVKGSLTDAVNAGVALGYSRGFLRASVVADPIRRHNTGDNTPAVIYYDVVPGDVLRVIVAPKGFGSENKSRVRMLNPSAGLDGVKAFVMDTVREAGPDACPPLVVGVGLGGTMDKAALLAKQALLRCIGEPNSDPYWAEVERGMLDEINKLGIGPGGFGGGTSALSVAVNVFPTHIAGLPVAVNVGCHATRHGAAVI